MSYTLPYHIQHHRAPERPVEVQATPEQVDHLAREGYLVFEGVFAGETLARLRDAFDTVAAREGLATPPDSHSEAAFLRHLMDKHPAFLELLRAEPFLSVARAALGPQVRVLPLTGRIAWPHRPGQATAWHIHQRVVPHPRPPFFSLPHVIDTLIYLDDVTPASGPLRLVPGSHLREGEAFPGGPHDPIDGERALTFSAGTAVMIHGNLWHGGLPTTPEGGLRRLLILPYAHAWTQHPSFGVRPADGLMAPLYDDPDPETRELLGIAEGLY